MPTNKETKDLIINKLTKEQFKTVTDSNTNNEVYHITDDAHYTEAEIEELLSTKQNTLTSSNAGTGISIQNGIISNTQTSAEWGNIQGDITSQSDLQSALGNKANDNEAVHLANNETITGAKSFTGPVNLIGSGDSNAVGISTNTRFNVHNTNKTVLGFGSGIFYINHGDYRLRLRGKDIRPHYNSDSNYLALLSDIPDTSNLATKDEIPDTSNFATKDEIPDTSNLAKDGEVVHLANSETVTGSKTFTQPLKIQNGAGTGSLIVGADINASTLNNGTRKLARIAVPTQTNKDLMATLLGFDSNGDDALHIKNKTYDAISFGGQTKITNATSPMSLGFCVTKTRNSTSASDKVYVLEMDSTEARFNVQPNYNGINLATTVDVTNALNSYAKLTDIPDISNLATKAELTEGLVTKQPTGNYIVNNAEEEGIAIGVNSTSFGPSAIAIGEDSSAVISGIGIGKNANASMIGAISIGDHSIAKGSGSIAIGNSANANLDNTIQLGAGDNETENSLQVNEYTLLDLSTGKIPDERLSNNIAKTTDIPDISNLASKDDIPDTSSFITMSDVEAEGYLKGVQINDADLEISSDKKVNIPLAGTNTLGVAKANVAYGVYANGGTLTISKATDAQVTAKTSQYRPIVPYNIDLAVKTGITTNTIELTDEEKSKAKEWLGINSGGGKDLFDVVLKDHLLSYEETEGYELLGNYVYKEAVAGSRYGYPDFYNKVIQEYNVSTSKHFKKYKSSNYIEKAGTLIGSLRDDKGVLSGFNNFEYFKIPYISSGAFEAVFKIRISDDVATNQYILGPLTTYKGMQLKIQNGVLSVFISSNGTSWNLANAKAGTYQFSPNKSYVYYVKVKFDGTRYVVSISTDGESYTDDITIESTASVWSDFLKLGNNDNNEAPFLGSIDLNECYITRNGEPYWNGCNYYEFDYVEHKNGHKFYDITNKDAVDELFNGCGMAWFYGVDTANERVYLPRNVWFEQSTSDISEVGASVDAGLPNIKGRMSPNRMSQGQIVCEGAFSSIYGTHTTAGYDSGSKSSDICFDASISNSIYGNSDNVQPNAVKKLAYMVVGNTSVESVVTDVVDVTTSENDTIPLFHNFWSKEDMTTTGCYVNASLGSFLSGNVYTTAYNTLVAKVGTGNVKSVSDAYTDYDFVVNADDMTFRLPLKNGQEIMFATGVKGNGNGLGVNSGTGYDFYLTQHAISNNSTRYFTTNYYSATIPKVGKKLDLDAGKDKGVAEGVLGLSEDATKSGIILDTENITIPDGWNLYYKVSNAVQNLELLDVAGITSDLNRKVNINSDVIDGQWNIVSDYPYIFTATAVGDYTVDISDYLPADNYVYEVMLKFAAYTTSDSQKNVYLGTDLMPITSEPNAPVKILVDSSVLKYCRLNPTLVTQNRMIYLKITGAKLNECSVNLVAYRRLGTNQ